MGGRKGEGGRRGRRKETKGISKVGKRKREKGKGKVRKWTGREGRKKERAGREVNRRKRGE